MNEKRVRSLLALEYQSGPVLYWMSRDQRANDNWALIFAQRLAKEKKTSLIIAFTLFDGFLGATLRQYDFMLEGLSKLENNLLEKNIPFRILLGNPSDEILKSITEFNIGAVVSDFDPLRIKKEWKRKVIDQISIPFYEVDSHNVVPVWVASQKQEFGAYTIRPKIHKLLNQFMEEFPKIEKQKGNQVLIKNDFDHIKSHLKTDNTVLPITWITPGEKAAKEILKKFIEEKLPKYAIDKNDPNKDALSNLSPYLHFGQISAQRIALEIIKTGSTACEVFLEELVVRRELADNFCQYNPHYDSFTGFPNWAKQTLDEHRKDIRQYNYSLKEFERGKTHDDLWNAAQQEMVKTGKMHGYMRMYWAKKILEWTGSPEEAMKTAIYLNDKYELDGRDPNGYVGIAWSIGGVHDRAWFEREIFGKVRYMSYNGCKGKFDIKKYIEKIEKI